MSIEYFPNWNISHSLAGGGAAPPPPAPEVETIIPPPLTEELRLEAPELEFPLLRELLAPLLLLLVPLLLVPVALLLSPPPADDRPLPPLSIQEETLWRIFREVSFFPPRI